MCGIIGYTGPLSAKNVLLEGLAQLEYRGYDSAGIAILDEDTGDVIIRKKVGKVANLYSYTEDMPDSSHCGIGHTRWATHGGVTDANAHPHRVGHVTLIHNGIIENYHQLASEYKLSDKLISDTDTEVAAALLDSIYDGDPLKSISKLTKLLIGTYAFCIMFDDKPGEIYCIRKVSPLVAAYCSSGSFVASDLTALIPYTKSYFVVPENHIVKLTAYKISIYDENLKETEPEILTVNWDINSAMKNGYPYYMLKEINEQPDALTKTISPRIVDGLPDFTVDDIDDSLFKTFNKIQVVACGTAMHTGIVAKSIAEPLLGIPMIVTIASEFRYEDPLIDSDTLTIVISQSGETIDTLEGMRLAKSKCSKTLAIVNVKGSTIARESDYVLYTHAGPEIAVASTKAYTVQLAALYMIIARMAYVRGIYEKNATQEFISDLLNAISAIKKSIEKRDVIEKCTKKIIKEHDAFFIGRGLDYAFSLEGALKLKEISYIHAEAYAAGELKHGTIALITDDVPVIAIATQEKTYSKTISNIKETKARGAYVILITKEGANPPSDVYDINITIPDMDDRFTVFPIAVILQLLAYYSSVGKGLDVDKPRNLAKSVTVE